MCGVIGFWSRRPEARCGCSAGRALQLIPDDAAHVGGVVEVHVVLAGAGEDLVEEHDAAENDTPHEEVTDGSNVVSVDFSRKK